MRRVDLTVLAIGAILCAALSPPPALAQGKSQDKGHGNGRPTVPPSRSVLPPASTIGTESGAAPFALIDDATVLPAGSLWTGVSVSRWSGAGLSEVDAPVAIIGVGLTPRVQLTASIPRVVGSADPAGAAGGLGTTFVTGKVDVTQHAWPVKVAVAPTLEVLGAGALSTSAAPGRRVRWGLPVSVELDRGDVMMYAGAGYFSGGVWFTGGGAGMPVSRRVAVSIALSRAQMASATGDPLDAMARTDLTGGASVAITSRFAAFGSIGHTIATADQNGAGMTISGGVSMLFVPRAPGSH